MLSIQNITNDAVLAYIRSELGSVFEFDLPAIEKGTVNAYLPLGSSLSPGEFHRLDHSLDSAIDIRGSNTELIHFIARYLQRFRPYGTVLSFTHWHPTDPHLPTRKTPYVLCDPPAGWTPQEPMIFLYLDADRSSFDEVEQASRQAGGYPRIDVLARTPLAGGRLTKGRYMTKEEMKILVTSADHVLVGAFDDEIKLIWTAPTAPTAYAPPTAAI